MRGQVGQETAGPEGGVALGAGDFVFAVSGWLGVEVGERCCLNRQRQGFALGNELLTAMIEIVV